MADLQRKTANLLDILSPEQSRWSATKTAYGVYYVADFVGVTAANRYRLPTVAGKTYTISGSIDNNAITVQLSNYLDDTTYPVEGDIRLQGNFSRTFTAQGQTTLSIFAREANQSATITDLIVYEGTTTIPYEDYGWQHSLRKLTTATESVENPLYSDGTAITAYTLKGNTVQDGTPTPSNPVEVNGVGERTAQLLDFNTWANNVYVVRGTKVVSGNSITITSTAATCFTGWNTTEYPAAARIPVTEGETIHLTWDTDADDSSSVWIFPNASATGEVHTAASNKSLDYTVPSGVDYITFRLDVATANKTITYSNIMFNSGSTAKPYEPYGYKIPISSGGVTTNIYLGSTQTVRRIKKVVLDGTESNWQQFSNLNLYLLPDTSLDYRAQMGGAICDSLPLVTRGDLTTNTFCWSSGTIGELIININNYNLADLKTYLNSNPITIWYVLATPETAAVNEPLMKIGTYADTLSNAASIPTTEGANSITVDTTVQPSEFTATWTGWHNSSVQEWDGSQWD